MRLQGRHGNHTTSSKSWNNSLSNFCWLPPVLTLIPEQRCNNEVERAIRQHALQSRYLGKERPSRSRPNTPTGSEEAFSADAFSPLPSPGPFISVNDTNGDAAPGHEHGTPEPPPGFSRHVRKSTVVDSRSSSHPASPVFPGNGLSNLQPLHATPDEAGEKLTIYGQPDLNASEPPKQVSDLEEWDYVLPRVPYAIRPNAELHNISETFDIREVVGAVQNGANLQMVRNYLERYGRETIRRVINDEVEGFPAIFYIAESNDESLLRLWIDHGGNPEAMHAPSKIPLLAFTIINSERIQSDTTLLTSTLLSLGAPPNVIPSAYYVPYLEDLSEDGREELAKQDEVNGSAPQDPDVTQWCTGAARTKLVKTLTLSQRYFLEKASKTKRPSQRQIQLAQRRNAEALLGLPFFLVGQTLASNLLLQKLLSHLISPGKRPLVLVFAGPSGHGKTELARKLGHLLSLELEVVDCTIFNREIELFGPREPYVGSEKGSPLNNFLARNAGKRCIVFLDEFEKTNSDIHNTLLLPFQNGIVCSVPRSSWMLTVLKENTKTAVTEALSIARKQYGF